MTDSLKIQCLERARGRIVVPASKSYTNRAYVVAALAEGTSTLLHPLLSDDTRYMRQALGALGIAVEEQEGAVVVQGQGGRLKAPDSELFIGNAGTAMRFLTTLATLAPGPVRLTGDHHMQKRPIGDLLLALNHMGIRAKSEKNNGCPPVLVEGGSPPGGQVPLPGDKSSQYLTSILLSAPYFARDTTVNIVGELTSKPYVDITLDIMRTFGVIVENASYSSFTVKAGQRYQPKQYRVEGDASSASYFFAAAAVTGGEVTVAGLNPDSAQGDIGFPGLLEQMGCDVITGHEEITVRGNRLRGIDVSMNDMPDVAPTLAVVALFAEGPTIIRGIANLRIKETDRIGALVTELGKLGARVESGPDHLRIEPGPLKGTLMETYDDHRMAMSFAIAGLRVPDVHIQNPRCVEKSFPDFFTRFQELYP